MNISAYKGILIKIFFFVLFSTSLLLGVSLNDYPYFTDQELETLAKENYITKNRLLDYQKTMQKLKTKNRDYQLQKVNFYLNQLLPQYDDVIQKKENSWATPKEFLTIGYGDCEDYVIIKYYSLIKLGFDEKKLFITVVKEKFYGGIHMVLTYFKTSQTPPLVLDNLSFKILPLDKRSDLHAKLLINSQGVFKISPTYKLIPVTNSYKEFQILQEKVKNNI